MRDRPPRNSAPRLDWPGGIVPEWAKPQGNNPNKRRRGKGKGGHGGHERQGGSSPGKRERLQKVMAQSGHGSRRNIEILIAQGHITINGQVAKLGDLVGPGDKVKMDGEFIQLRFGDPLPRVLLYHKPDGEIVSRDDPEGRATVFEKLPRVHNGRWVSIGRLDLNTGGLLLFTTNGELANRMTHPRFEVEREYAVRLMGELGEETRAKLLSGIDIEGESCKFDLIEDRGGEGSNHWHHVVLREGKNREVRKMFETVGLMVSRLMRVRFGPIAMPTFLKRGMMKEMEEADVAKLMEFCGVKPEGLQVAAPAPAVEVEEDPDAQPPGISHTQSTLLHNITQAPGGVQGQGKHRGQRHQRHGQGQHGQGQGHGQGGQGHGQGGQGHGQGGQGHGQGGQGQGPGQKRQGKHRKHRKGGGQAGPGGVPQQGGREPQGNQPQGNQPQGGNQQRQAWQGNKQGGHGGQGKPGGGHRGKQQQQRGPRGDEQPRFNPTENRPPRGDEQPSYKEPAENQRGDEQPLTNENRRVW